MRPRVVNGARRRLVLLLLPALFAAASCGGSADKNDGNDEGGGDRTFTMAMPAIPNNLDLAVYEGTPSSEVGIVYSASLYQFVDPAGVSDEDLGMTGLESVAPLLVESDKEEKDGSLVVTLKEAKSPYGNTLTAEDVKWTFERAIELDFVAQFVLSIGRVDTENPIEVIDDRTFRVNVTKPNPYVRGVLTLWDLSPMDSTEVKKHVTKDDPWATKWLTSNSATYGPYNVSGFTAGKQVTLDANPNWVDGEPAYNKVVMQGVPDAGSRLQLLTRGEVDYAASLQPDQFASLQNSDDVQTTTRRSNTLVMVEPNEKFEPFKDPRVREALAYAIDRQAIVDGPMHGFATVQGNFISKGIGQPEPPEGYTYDPDKARQLLEEAGYGDGLEFPLTISLARPGPYAEQIAVMLEQQFEAVGMQVDIQPVASASEFEDRKVKGEYKAWLGANTPVVPDAWYQLQLDHHSTEAFQNHKGYASPEFDALMGELRDLPIGEERDAKLTEVHELLMKDAPYAPIFDQQILIAVNSSVDISTVRQYSPFGPIVSEIKPAE